MRPLRACLEPANHSHGRLFNYKRLEASLTPNQRENPLYIVYIILPEAVVRINCLAILMRTPLVVSPDYTLFGM